MKPRPGEHQGIKRAHDDDHSGGEEGYEEILQLDRFDQEYTSENREDYNAIKDNNAIEIYTRFLLLQKPRYRCRHTPLCVFEGIRERIAFETSRLCTITSVVWTNSSALMVNRSGSPGPAHTKYILSTLALLI